MFSSVFLHVAIINNKPRVDLNDTYYIFPWNFGFSPNSARVESYRISASAKLSSTPHKIVPTTAALAKPIRAVVPLPSVSLVGRYRCLEVNSIVTQQRPTRYSLGLCPHRAESVGHLGTVTLRTRPREPRTILRLSRWAMTCE